MLFQIYVYLSSSYSTSMYSNVFCDVLGMMPCNSKYMSIYNLHYILPESIYLNWEWCYAILNVCLFIFILFYLDIYIQMYSLMCCCPSLEGEFRKELQKSFLESCRASLLIPYWYTINWNQMKTTLQGNYKI